MSDQLLTKTPIFTALLVGYLNENKSTVNRVLLNTELSSLALVSLPTRAVTATSFITCIKHQYTPSIMYTQNPRLQ